MQSGAKLQSPKGFSWALQLRRHCCLTSELCSDRFIVSILYFTSVGESAHTLSIFSRWTAFKLKAVRLEAIEPISSVCLVALVGFSL
jgi:hypothetical protein